MILKLIASYGFGSDTADEDTAYVKVEQFGQSTFQIVKQVTFVNALFSIGHIQQVTFPYGYNGRDEMWAMVKGKGVLSLDMKGDFKWAYLPL